MNILSEVVAWFADPAHWQGPDAVATRLLEHVQVSAIAVLAAVVVAVPAGLVIGHTGRGAFLVTNLANLGRAVPSFALLLMLIPVAYDLQVSYGLPLDFSFWPILGAMVLLAIPPIVTNVHAGIREVDRDLVEAARGMGMTGRQVLFSVELPLALPVVLTGIRLAAVQVVATLTLGAVAGGGGLGRYIYDGFAQQDQARMLAGAALVALLAIVVDVAFGVLIRLTAPGTSSAAHGVRAPEPAAREA